MGYAHKSAAELIKWIEQVHQRKLDDGERRIVALAFHNDRPYYLGTDGRIIDTNPGPPERVEYNRNVYRFIAGRRYKLVFVPAHDGVDVYWELDGDRREARIGLFVGG